MADRIEIETRLLAQDKESIQTQVQRLRTQKNRLQDRMEQLSGMWEGPAKETFLNQFLSDCEYMESFFSELDAYVQAMEYAEKEYNKCENDVAQIVAAIEI
ncbi:MAG TPA: WXG100 family type VII secretion target [Candidatus Blautia pullicola]|uniref:WXG100 family type VII secretion target n=1 Tax=Candidatus Blautia pullicola TaxID=2838498 RepID=A0A9D2FQ35_9FIRM|nr:WXG100 family type VII secretion target [Candidatus Blautia pullicola]